MTEQQGPQKKILRYLDSIGAYSIKIVQANRAGVPDIICCLNGFFVAIECKRKGNKAKVLQEYKIEKIKAAGGIAFVADNVSQVILNLQNASLEIKI